MGQPVKVADDLILDARVIGKLAHRSIAGQIEFWAHLGEAIEPLLQGEQVLAILRAGSARALSACLDPVDSPKGRSRVKEYLKTGPFPHYEPAPRRPGLLVRIEADGARTVGRFIRREFTPVD